MCVCLWLGPSVQYFQDASDVRKNDAIQSNNFRVNPFFTFLFSAKCFVAHREKGHFKELQLGLQVSYLDIQGPMLQNRLCYCSCKRPIQIQKRNGPILSMHRDRMLYHRSDPTIRLKIDKITMGSIDCNSKT